MPALPQLTSIHKDEPLPIIVAQKWNFSLAFLKIDAKTLFSIQDWISGLTAPSNPVTIWADIKRRGTMPELLASIQRLPYVSNNGKTYQMDFTDDKGLYLIAQHLRVTKLRPALGEIQRFLAEAGAFVDLVRREPEVVVTSGAINPDEAIDAAIKVYRARGKDEKWISARIEGKIKRERFTAALQIAVTEVLTRLQYAMATDEIYKGLWGRTAAILKDELNLPRNASLRDHQPKHALTYQGLAEDIAADKLGERAELTWKEAKHIVRVVAELIGEQAKATSRFLKIDLATGKPLLPKGK